MLIVPVIDLLAGQAVRAVAGRREHYQPLSSALCASADPADVVRAYRTLFPFDTFYLADLDAIERRGDNRDCITRLQREFVDYHWWLDAGFAIPSQLPQQNNTPSGHDHNRGCLRAVLGSESQTDLASFQTLLNAARERNLEPLLSLDYKNGRFLGPPELETAAALWPPELIVMRLDRVGVGAGPAIDSENHTQKPAVSRVYAAGGVRHGGDLNALHVAGYAGVLVASALHDGGLSSTELRAVATEVD